jgi:uncharacterized protein (TIGR03067 family)
MRGLALGLCLTFSLIPIRPDRQAPAVPDIEQLQGTWEVIAFETPESKLDAAALKKYPKLIIKGNEYRWSTGGSGIFKLDPTRSPKGVDYGMPPGQGSEGIYELQGDIFRDCIAPAGKSRPITFGTPPGSGYILQVYRRVR